MKDINWKKFDYHCSQAYRAHKSMDGHCSNIFNIIEGKIQINDDYGAHVFIQDGDGLVLSWQSHRGVANTPVRRILVMHEDKGQKLNDEDLLSISI